MVVVLLAALVLGRLRGGRLARLGALPLRSRRLVLVALLVQAAGALAGGAAYPVGLAVSALLALAFLGRNRGLPGGVLLALGLLLNAVVVGVNGAMPVSRHAAARAGLPDVDLVLLGDPRHAPADAGTRLRPLGDVVPVPLPWRPEVVSPGDVAVAAGLGELVVLAMLGSGRRGGPAGPAPRRPAPPARPRRPGAPRPPRPAAPTPRG